MRILLKILILALLPMGYILMEFEESTSHAKHHSCKILNNNFTQKANTFVECVLQNNNGGTFCQKCLKDYVNVTHYYNLLLEGEETVKGTNITCRSLYVDNNQLNLVDTVYANAKRFWELGACSGKTYSSSGLE